MGKSKRGNGWEDQPIPYALTPKAHALLAKEREREVAAKEAENERKAREANRKR